MRKLIYSIASVAFTVLSISPQQSSAQSNRAPTAAAIGESNVVQRRNAWTVGLATGTPEGTFLRFGADIAQNLNEPGKLRILPIATRGAADNIKDLLYLKGIDAAITHTDVFEHFRTVERIRNLDKRIHFISGMYTSEIHLIVRSDINSIEDLEGKKVSLHSEGAGSSISGPIIFKRLGIKIEPVFMNNALALESIKKGEIAGLVHSAGKPNNLITRFKNDAGLKLLPIPFEKFDDYYVPSEFSHDDYPNFIAEEGTVETIAVPTILAVYNWPKSSNRFRRVTRFIDRYFARFEDFKRVPYHPKWKELNPAAKLPGWNRYWYAENKVKEIQARQAKERIDLRFARDQVRRAAPGDRNAQEKLFKQFLDWAKTRKQ